MSKSNDEDFVKYVAGETVQLSEARPNGWYQKVVVQRKRIRLYQGSREMFWKLLSKGLRFQSEKS